MTQSTRSQLEIWKKIVTSLFIHLNFQVSYFLWIYNSLATIGKQLEELQEVQ